MITPLNERRRPPGQPIQPSTPGTPQTSTPVTPLGTNPVLTGYTPPQGGGPTAPSLSGPNTARTFSGNTGGVTPVQTGGTAPGTTGIPGGVSTAVQPVAPVDPTSTTQFGNVNSQILDILKQYQDANANNGVFNQANTDLDRSRQLTEQAGEFSAMNPAIQRALESLASRTGGGGAAAPNVDRIALAERALRRFDESGAPEFDRQIRGVGRAAAAFGRTGSGMTTNDLTDVVSQQRDARRRFGEGVMDNALGQTVSDALNAYNAQTGRIGTNLSGLTSLGSLDMQGRSIDANNAMARAGMFSNIAGQGVGIDNARISRIGDSLGATTGVSGHLFNQGRTLDRDRVQDAQNEAILENQFANDAFRRAMEQLGLFGSLGQFDTGAGNAVTTSLFG